MCSGAVWLVFILLPIVEGSETDGNSMTTFILLRSEFSTTDKQVRLAYSFHSEGRRMMLELERNRHILPAGFFSERWSDGKVRQRKLLNDAAACLFTGVVKQEGKRREARAAFELCSGMNGHFFSDEGVYVVRPVHENSFGGAHVVGRVRRSTATEQDGSDDVDEAATVQSEERKKATVEVALVADSDVLQLYGKKTEAYLLSLMNAVSTLFRDGSLGDIVDIVLSRLIILEDDSAGLAVSSDAQVSLSKFCEWQKSIQQSSSGQTPDISILLSRKNICDQRIQDCDVLGLANLRGACAELSNCAIVEDVGQTSAVAIAHEIGHLLGMRHDGDGNECQANSHSNIMATTLVSSRGSHSKWSDCSREDLMTFLKSETAQCLMQPHEVKPELKQRVQDAKGKLPGQMFTLEDQCQIAHGPDSLPCHMHLPGNSPCDTLWCSTPTRRCISYMLPWADGTACSEGKWCIKGQCINDQTDLGKKVPTDGGWSEWSEYGHCSRTCGGGVRISHRKCNSPSPQNGGKYCVGERHRYASCSLSGCPNGSPSFRESQCAEFDHKTVQISGRLWLTTWEPKPLTGKGHECRLLCYNYEKSVLAELAPVVRDGTSCRNDGDGICVQGKCLKTGCDYILGSDKRVDQCGVCGGDNSSCDVVSGSFQPAHTGFSTVVAIPKGAGSIQIQQLSDSYRDGSYLALQNKHGQYLFNNGYYIQSYSGSYHAAGTTVKYSGASSRQEWITAKGPLHEELIVKVLNFNLNPSEVRFSFSVPKVARETRNNTSSMQRYTWMSDKRWSVCSKLCEGIQVRRVRCQEVKMKKVVSNKYCVGIDQPPQHSRQCNTVCPTRWVVQNVSSCSASCGGGITVRQIQCVQMHGTAEQKPVPDGKCSTARPVGSIQCNTDPCPIWKASKWNECSNKCGRGLQQRTIKCTIGNSNGATTTCDRRQKPVTARVCFDMTCPKWNVYSWTMCSHSCGGGHQTATAACQSIAGLQLSPSLCETISKPKTSRRCNEQKCPEWQASSWSECSRNCGSGVMTRNVRCVYQGQVVGSSNCSGLSKPAESQSCVVKVCTQWRTGQWGQCPGSCMYAVQTRLVWCEDEQGDKKSFGDCDWKSQPVYARLCKAMCPEWQSGPWGQCTSSCGGGLQKRHVECVDRTSRTQLHTSVCSKTSRPSVIQQCNLSPCHRWQAGDWKTCTCKGFQERKVFCSDEDGNCVDDGDCVHAQRPSANQSCEVDLTVCPGTRWSKAKWSDCSAVCGKGVREREVFCVSDYGDTVPDSDCQEKKPKGRRSCIAKQPCGRWITGRWTKCSAGCGPRGRQRLVKCVSVDGLPSSSCNEKSKPSDSKPCRQKCYVTNCQTSLFGRSYE